MKKSYLFALLLMAVPVFVSCGNHDDDDEPDVPGQETGKPGHDDSDEVSDLYGKWELTRTTQAYEVLEAGMEDFYDTTPVITPGDGTYWEITSSKITIHDPSGNKASSSYTYDEEEDLLIVSGGPTYDIESLDEDEMVLSYSTDMGPLRYVYTLEFVKR